MCGRVLVSRKHSRERNTFCTCFAKALQSTSSTWPARGVELRSRVDGRPEQLRVRVHLPLASDAIAFLLPVATERTQFCVAGVEINLFLARHEKGQERAFGTIWNARASSCLVIPTKLYLHKQACARGKNRVSDPNVLPPVSIFGRDGISRVSYRNSNLYFKLYLLLSLYVCARFSVFGFVFACWCARASPYLFL